MWPVNDGGSSGSSDPAVPEDVVESDAVKMLVAPISANGNRPRRAHGQWACSVQNLVLRVLHRTWPDASALCRWKRDHDSSDCH